MKRVECPEWLHHELLNWSRYCWMGAYPHPLPLQQCASFEGNYSRFGDGADADAIDRNAIPVNLTNAKIVQGVYEILPYLPQQALRAEYPQRHEQKRVVKASKAEYDSALSVAIFRVMMAFDGGGY